MPFCHIQIKAQKPVSAAYPTEILTLGDHIRKKRLDLNLRQKDIAKILGVTEASVFYWETHRSSPQVGFIPKIIKFLEYLPYDNIINMTLGEKITACREIKGISQKELARQLGFDPATVSQWENNYKKPLRSYLEVLNAFLDPIIQNMLSAI